MNIVRGSLCNVFESNLCSPLKDRNIYLNMIFKILREWYPLKIILSVWTPKSHIRLINTRVYFRRVVSIRTRVW